MISFYPQMQPAGGHEVNGERGARTCTALFNSAGRQSTSNTSLRLFNIIDPTPTLNPKSTIGFPLSNL